MLTGYLWIIWIRVSSTSLLTVQYFLPRAIISVVYSRIAFRLWGNNFLGFSKKVLPGNFWRFLPLWHFLALLIIMYLFRFSAQACWQFNTSFLWPLFQWPTRASHFDYGAARLRVQLKMKGITSYLPTRKKWVLSIYQSYISQVLYTLTIYCGTHNWLCVQ